MGNKIVSIAHIQSLLNLKSVSKDEHHLVQSDINPEDRQNFSSLEKIMHDRVLNALSMHVVGCEGTIMYLKLCKFITSSFLENKLTPIERIYNIWYAVFFLRCWKKSIQTSNELSIEQNFISLNAYTCVEINAHNLIEIVRKMRSDRQEKMFLPSYFSSQPCENTFRMMRSLGTTNFTKINFTLIELFHMVSRVEIMNKIIYDSDEIKFPRARKTTLETAEPRAELSAESSNFPFSFPSDEQIQNTITKARDAALKDAVLFDIKLNADIVANTELSLNKSVARSVGVDEADDEASEEDAMEDKIIHENEIEHQTDKRYIYMSDSNGTESKMLKSRFIWMHCKSKDKLSSDRLKRVQRSAGSSAKSTPKKKRKTSDDSEKVESNLFRRDEIMIGDWVIFDLKKEPISSSLENDVAELDGCIIGMILGFRYMNEKNKSMQYKAQFVNLSTENKTESEKKNSLYWLFGTVVIKMEV